MAEPEHSEAGHGKHDARGRRNIAIALALAAFVLLVFAITIIRLQPEQIVRPL